MKCSFCGNEYDSSVHSCPACGAQGEGTEQNTGYQRPPYPTAVEIIKQVAAHKLFLPAAILWSVNTAYAVMEFFASGSIDVIAILVTIGVWMLYAEAKKPTVNPYSMDVSSLKVLKASMTVQLVAVWILIVCAAIVSICLIIVAFNTHEKAAMLQSVLQDIKMSFNGMPVQLEAAKNIINFIGQYFPIIVVLFVLISGGGLTFMFLLVTGIRRYFTSVIESAETGLKPKKLSSTAPVLLIIAVSLNLLSNLSSIHSIAVIVPCLFVCAGAVAAIMFAIILLDTKKLTDSSYYPSEEEAFYNRQSYYAYVNSQRQARYTQYITSSAPSAAQTQQTQSTDAPATPESPSSSDTQASDN